MKSVAFVSSLVAFFVACTPTEIPAGDAAAGEGLFTTNCVSCHGADAKSGSARQDLPGEVGNENEFFNTVVAGKGGMPAFGAELSDQEIADIMAWVATL